MSENYLVGEISRWWGECADKDRCCLCDVISFFPSNSGVCNNNPDDDITDSNGRAYSTKLPKEVDQFGAAWMKNVKDHDHAQCFPVEPQCPPEAEYPECPTELPSDECINCENRCHLTHSKCKACEVDPCEVSRVGKGSMLDAGRFGSLVGFYLICSPANKCWTNTFKKPWKRILWSMFLELRNS